MTKLTRRLAMTGCALAAMANVGCSREPESWIPVLEESSTAFLKTETEAVASRVRSARSQLPVNPEDAAADLAAAEDGLDHLLTYYLPLLEARERAYNAYRHFYLGKAEETARELDEVEAILMTVAEAGPGHPLRAMEEPLERLEDARVALGVDTGEAAEALQALANRLNYLLLKGRLVLAD
jgi:hypothetical protein